MGDFGKFCKNRRITIVRKTLRQFCLDGGFDWGGPSRIERGLAPPPVGDELQRYAEELRIESDTNKSREFFNLAEAEAGQAHVMTKSEAIRQLPPLLRFDGDRAKLDELVERIRTS